MVIHDDRPMTKPPIPTGAFRESSSLHIDRARSILMRIVGSDPSTPLPSRIPEHLQKSLSGLADNRVKAEAVAAAAKKLSPDDTQVLVDVLDLVSPLFVCFIVKEAPHQYCLRSCKKIPPSSTTKTLF
jgi:hypothetical protein